MTKSNQSPALGFIFMTLLIDVIGIGIIIPVMPALIQQLTYGDISHASRLGGWLSFVFAFMMFLCAPTLGNLSDHFGRRPVLLFALLGTGLDYVFLSVAPSIEWLFVGRIMAGITGASFSTATAYIADVSTPENRTKNFGLIGVAFGLGFILGPVAGGLLGSFGTRVPFIASAILSLLNTIYGFFVLPESLSKEHRRPFEWTRANPLGALIQLKKYPVISNLAVCLFLVYIGSQSVQSIWTFFSIEKFQWSDKMIGYSLGTVGLMVGLVQGLLIRKINPCLGNERSIVAGLLLYTLGLVLFSIANQGWMMFVITIPYCLGGIAGPALQSMMSAHVPANAQGELQGGLTGLMSISFIIGPLLMTNLFSYFTSPAAPFHFAGAPFLMGACFMLSGVFVARFNFKKKI